MDDRKETQLVTNSDCYRAGKTIRPHGDHGPLHRSGPA